LFGEVFPTGGVDHASLDAFGLELFKASINNETSETSAIRIIPGRSGASARM
jgi:hypothetical protein